MLTNIYIFFTSIVDRIPYSEIFGGAIALTKEQFLDTNGFSNNYYGWGGEDDDMFRR